MIKNKFLKSLVFITFSILTAAILVNAAQSYRVNNGTSVDINEWSVCKKVTNNTGKDIFVPTNTSNEWNQFRTYYPSGISLAECWSCGQTFTDSRDGKSYATVLIGSQCWMAQNLNYGTMTLGTNGQGTDCPSVAETEKYCYGNSESNCTSDGALYQWQQAMCGAASCNGTGAPPNDRCASPVQGICPPGWHIPSHYEWTTLERAVCTSGTCSTDFPYNTTTTGDRGTNEGTKLKSGGSSGFNAVMTGKRDTNGSFIDRGNFTYFWPSLQKDSSYSWNRALYSTSALVGQTNTADKLKGYAVRCIHD